MSDVKWHLMSMSVDVNSLKITWEVYDKDGGRRQITLVLDELYKKKDLTDKLVDLSDYILQNYKPMGTKQGESVERRRKLRIGGG